MKILGAFFGLVIACWVLAALFLFSFNKKGDSKNGDNIPKNVVNINVISSEFKSGDPIPKKYTCDGDNINPPISLEGIPTSAKSLGLVVEDPDAPGGSFTHWVVIDIDPKITQVSESSIPGSGKVLQNSSGKDKYTGPCPPSGTHHYHFNIYAFN